MKLAIQKKHGPKNFRYLVHALNPHARFSQLFGNLLQIIWAYKVNKSEGDQSINLFDQPERLGEQVSLSMSLTDQEHTKTWEQGEIIIEASEENIVITSPTHMGSHNSSKDFLRRQAQNQSRLSGEQLLRLTPHGYYNEFDDKYNTFFLLLRKLKM